jgi:hypothetical protein
MREGQQSLESALTSPRGGAMRRGAGVEILILHGPVDHRGDVERRRPLITEWDGLRGLVSINLS